MGSRSALNELGSGDSELGLSRFSEMVKENSDSALYDTESAVLSPIVAATTFLNINDYREENNLEPLAEDQRLCAYAQRRL